jgi:hypothetical protein
MYGSRQRFIVHRPPFVSARLVIVAATAPLRGAAAVEIKAQLTFTVDRTRMNRERLSSHAARVARTLPYNLSEVSATVGKRVIWKRIVVQKNHGSGRRCSARPDIP